jgi:hypothetical protein
LSVRDEAMDDEILHKLLQQGAITRAAATLAKEAASVVAASSSSSWLARSILRHLCEQDDQDHSPDRQQGVPHRVGDGVTEPGDLAVGAIIDHAK